VTGETGAVDIEFRPLRTDDLPQPHRWLNEPAVVRWWEGEDVSWGAVRSEYGPPHTDGTEHRVATDDDHGA
jgi:hypothetical protein